MLVRMQSLAKRYGKTHALAGLSLAVPPGQVTGFLGRNGAGKTTTLRILMGIVAADAGSVELFGVARKRPTLGDRRRIGYVSQEPAFYPWMTATELGRFVAGFYPTWDAERFVRLLRAFDVDPGRRASALSGGTRAKLALALALAPRPELLVLDEPTAGLDPVARREFLDIVLDGTRGSGGSGGHSVLLSSHLVDEVERIADHVVVIERGRDVWSGAPSALLDEMREVDLRGGEVPPGFVVVKRLGRTGRSLLRAPVDAWPTLPPDQVFTTSLEEAFLGLVARAGDGDGNGADADGGRT